MRHTFLMSLLLSLFLMSSWASAAPTDDFEQLFGDEIKRVQSTRSVEDDVVLAKRMLESAATLKPNEPMLVPLFNFVFEQGRKTEAGYDMALEAMRRLGEQFPDREAEAQAKVIALLKTAYLRSRGDARKSYGDQLITLHAAAGLTKLGDGGYRAALLDYREALKVARAVRSDAANMMQARVEQATEMLAAKRQVELIEKKLATPPVDLKLLKELVQLCIAKLNDPERLAAYSLIIDKVTRQKIERANTAVDQVDADGCADLGNWYAELAKPERKLIKLALLERAEAYLERFLTLSAPQEDQPQTVTGLKVALSLKRVKAEIEKLDLGGAEKTKWIDLDPEYAKAVADRKWDGEGTVTYKDGVFELEGKKTRLFSSAEIKDIIISVEVKRISGSNLAIAGRVTKTTSVWTSLVLPNVVTLNRWEKATGPTELGRVAVSASSSGKFVRVQLAVIGDTLITYINGKEVLRTKNGQISDGGQVAIGVHEAKMHLKNPRYAIPSPELIKKLLAGKAKP